MPQNEQKPRKRLLFVTSTGPPAPLPKSQHSLIRSHVMINVAQARPPAPSRARQRPATFITSLNPHCSPNGTAADEEGRIVRTGHDSRTPVAGNPHLARDLVNPLMNRVTPPVSIPPGETMDVFKVLPQFSHPSLKSSEILYNTHRVFGNRPAARPTCEIQIMGSEVGMLSFLTLALSRLHRLWQACDDEPKDLLIAKQDVYRKLNAYLRSIEGDNYTGVALALVCMIRMENVSNKRLARTHAKGLLTLLSSNGGLKDLEDEAAAQTCLVLLSYANSADVRISDQILTCTASPRIRYKVDAISSESPIYCPDTHLYHFERLPCCLPHVKLAMYEVRDLIRNLIPHCLDMKSFPYDSEEAAQGLTLEFSERISLSHDGDISCAAISRQRLSAEELKASALLLRDDLMRSYWGQTGDSWDVFKSFPGTAAMVQQAGMINLNIKLAILIFLTALGYRQPFHEAALDRRLCEWCMPITESFKLASRRPADIFIELHSRIKVEYTYYGRGNGMERHGGKLYGTLFWITSIIAAATRPETDEEAPSHTHQIACIWAESFSSILPSNHGCNLLAVARRMTLIQEWLSLGDQSTRLPSK